MDDRFGLEDLNFLLIYFGLIVCIVEVLLRLDIIIVFKGWLIFRIRKYLKKRKWWKFLMDIEMKYDIKLKWVCKIEIG